MMIRQILTVCAVAAAGATATTFAGAQQVYQTAPGAYSPAPTPYPADSRGRGPDFDALDDEDMPGNSAALPPPGPVLSPDDPRYGRPANAPVYGAAPNGPILSPDDPRYGRPASAPVYSAAPTGPVMSPDDPRYGRPAGPPPVIYGDRPASAQQAYGTYGNGAPGGDAGAPRPPGAVSGAVTGTVQAPAGDRPLTVAALPPEEQPDAAPAPLPANLRRQEVDFVTKEPPGTIVVDTPNTYLYLVLGNGRAMRYGVRVGREGFTWTGVQKITKKTEWPDWYPPSEMIERQPYLPR
ncbi:L,D-transpeptidase family protein, partial [Bradyrhizobium sp.]